MHVLVLGGTIFLGRHVVDAALRRGHRVSIFHRGRSPSDVPPEVETLLGDRDDDLAPLAGRHFDAVIDTCGYTPARVTRSARALSDAAEAYVFVSSLSVLADPGPAGQDESAPLAELPADASPDVVTGETYGALKALCEKAVREHFPGRVLVLRPGLIVGPRDPSDRFTYWPRRVAQAGDLLVPPLSQAVQFLDARDLADWMLRLLEARLSGTLNAAGPRRRLTLGELLARCAEVLGVAPHLVECDDGFLLEHAVRPFVDLPLWLPPDAAGLLDVSLVEALACGLAFRDLGETIADTYAWDASRPRESEVRAGLTLERERELLAAWASRG
ncbi:MAG: NAD-dependent epimerase/dehydratase family protein [Planctomycetes bacterium]|nr:NAD-dependent epimerase/dehydratase family protein [Planctomycetota bacterium]